MAPYGKKVKGLDWHLSPVFLLSVNVFSRKRQKCHMPGALDRGGHGSLVLGAGSRLAARKDPPPVVDVAPQQFVVFIVDPGNFIDAEVADPISAATEAPSAATSARSAPPVLPAIRSFVIVERDIIIFIIIVHCKSLLILVSC
jgi:hypothetical protein